MEDGGEPRALTSAQQARRQRLIDAAMVLGAEGGYEAVQMRDVAARADVAMGTLYRYFASKDHLLAATLVHWIDQLRDRVTSVPALGSTAPERVGDVLDRALRAMARRPRLAAALTASMASADPAAAACQRRAAELVEEIIAGAVGDPRPPDLPDRIRLIGHVWYSSLVGWLNGVNDVASVHDELEIALRLLLTPAQTPVSEPVGQGA